MNEVIRYESVELVRNDMTILGNVTLNVVPGDFIYLTGRVGSGKTTLLRSMFADCKISHGYAQSIGYNLVNINKKDIPYLRRQIGFIFQDFKLLNDRDIFSNLDFVLAATGTDDQRTRHDRIDQVLQMIGLSDKSYRMPYELSGGEQQRVSVARAILNNPRLILADEPTGNLDNETGDSIIGMLYNIACSGTAVVIATHNMRLLERFPGRRWICQDKKLIVL